MSRRRKITLIAVALLLGVTYFIPASDTPSSSAYDLLDPVLTQTAAAVACNNQRCVQEGVGGPGWTSANFYNCAVVGSTCTTTGPHDPTDCGF